MLLLVSLYSLLIRNIIQISLYILNTILLSFEPITLPQISISYRISSKLRSPQPNSVIRSPLIYNIFPYLILKQVIKFLLRLNSLELLNSQRSYLKNTSDLIKSSLSLVLYCLSSVSQSLYILCIQSSISLCLNQLFSILSPREHNQLLYQYHAEKCVLIKKHSLIGFLST